MIMAMAETAVPETRAPDATEDEETAWVARARAGDTGAFERLYRRHVARVHGLCCRLCHGDRAKAEQATQDAFVRAWEKLDTFRGEARFGTWLHRITVNVALGEHRLLQRWTSFEDAESSGVPAELAVEAPDSDLSRDLERALARLPKGARTVLWLHDVEGYLHEEISALTGIAVGTSKAQLHRARRLMKEHLR
jgi:RNA polymerase sigma factor (sigma-70 family)